MKSGAPGPSRVEWRGASKTHKLAQELAHAGDFGDICTAPAEALRRARRVYLAGNDLPARWAGREHFTVLESGFGAGHNFIATWHAWQQDPARSRWLHYVAVEGHPLERDDLSQVHAHSPLRELAQALAAAWPEITPNLHALAFAGGRVRLLLAFGDIHAVLRELRCTADAFFIDGFAPERNPAMWTPQVMKALGRRAAPGATAASWVASPALAEGLAAAGFEVDRVDSAVDSGPFTRARWQPRFVPRSAPQPRPRPAADVVVVGAGLAGAFAARALHTLGWQVRVFDQHAQPAQEASGNPGGVFHGTVHPQDGPHARLLRAAALQAQRSLHPLLAAGFVPGQADGLLRVMGPDDGPRRERGLAGMQAVLAQQRLPAGYVQALDGSQASRRAGLPLAGPAWFFPGGGWVAPRALVQHVLHGLPFVGGTRVAALRQAASRWQLLGADGAVLAEAAAVVLANAAQAVQLLAPWGAAAWPLRRVRGQLSLWHGTASGLALPLSGHGYALPLPAATGGGLLCGASAHADDDERIERSSDHHFNLQRLASLCGLAAPAGVSVTGRVGWRVQAEDRQPVVGPVPDLGHSTHPARIVQARWLSRCEGLFVCTALGGRGITLAPLMGGLVAAQVAGTPLPLEQSLLDAVDPGRWPVRAARRG